MRMFICTCAYNQFYRHIYIIRVRFSLYLKICAIIIMLVGVSRAGVHSMWHQTGSMEDIRGDSDQVTSQTADIDLRERIMFLTDKYLLQTPCLLNF